jgi:dUTP pyrophosphatase
MFRSGVFVADHIDPITDTQIQPNGVDLTLAAVYDQRTPGRIGVDGTEIGERELRSPAQPAGDGAAVYHLSAGAYVAQYAETITIPPNHVGFVYPRSSLLRNSCMLNTAVWDAGYSGKGEGLLQVSQEIEIESGARIAQLVLAKAKHDGLYEGSYQNERL